MTGAVLVPVTGPVRALDAPTGDARALAGLVGAPWLDFVTIRDHRVLIAVDDEGLLKGLPANPRATVTCAWLFGRRPEEMAYPLVGDVLFLGVDTGGETIDVPPVVAELLSTAEGLLADPTNRQAWERSW